MSAALKVDFLEQGALPAWLVAALSGLKQSRLARWRRRGVLPANAAPGRRGVPCYYSWTDYARILAAAKLLEKGLPPRKLKETLTRLDTNYPGWEQRPLTVMARIPIIDPGSELPQTVEAAPQGAHMELIDSAPLDDDVIYASFAVDLPQKEDAQALWDEIKQDGPLGKLHQFMDAVNMDPGIHGGAPVVRGHRIETATIAKLSAGGMSIADLYDAYRLTADKVRRVLLFEQAIQQALGMVEPVYAPAAR